MSWTLALWLGVAGAVDCADVLDRTTECAAPAATQSLPEPIEVTPRPAASVGDTLAPRMFAASGVGAFVALGAGITAGFFQKHLADLAATGNLSRAVESEMRLYTSVSSIASVGAGIGATLLLAAGGAFAVFEPADGNLRAGIPPLQE